MAISVTGKSNGSFVIIKPPYCKKQHPNQQEGLDKYVDVLDLDTGNVNSVKLYDNTKGIHFKKGGSHYLKDFTMCYTVTPYQVQSESGEIVSADWRIVRSNINKEGKI